MLTKIVLQDESYKLVTERYYEFQIPLVSLDEFGNLKVINHPERFKTEQLCGDNDARIIDAPQ